MQIYETAIKEYRIILLREFWKLHEISSPPKKRKEKVNLWAKWQYWQRNQNNKKVDILEIKISNRTEKRNRRFQQQT